MLTDYCFHLGKTKMAPRYWRDEDKYMGSWGPWNAARLPDFLLSLYLIELLTVFLEKFSKVKQNKTRCAVDWNCGRNYNT